MRFAICYLLGAGVSNVIPPGVQLRWLYDGRYQMAFTVCQRLVSMMRWESYSKVETTIQSLYIPSACGLTNARIAVLATLWLGARARSVPDRGSQRCVDAWCRSWRMRL